MRVHPLLLAALLCAATGTVCAQGAPDAEATSARVHDQLDAGDFAAVTSRDAPRVTQQAGMTVVVTRIHRTQASLDATVAIDAAGRVAGLHFAPATP